LVVSHGDLACGSPEARRRAAGNPSRPILWNRTRPSRVFGPSARTTAREWESGARALCTNASTGFMGALPGTLIVIALRFSEIPEAHLGP
jgi:hypothetical protein